MNMFLFILTNNISPIFLIIFIGVFIGRKFELDVNTLVKLNLYIFMPVFTFVQVYSINIPANMYKVLLFGCLILVANSFICILASKFSGHDLAFSSSFKNSVIFFNSGNFGIPLITLIFSNAPYIIDGKTPYLDLALTTQILAMVVQAISTFTIGYFNASLGKMNMKESIKSIFKIPLIYAIFLAIFLKFQAINIISTPIGSSLTILKGGMVPFSVER